MCDSGYISAFEENKSLEENKKAHKRLLAALLGMGYQTSTFTNGTKYFIKVFDVNNSNTLQEDLIKAGGKLNQRYILYQHNDNIYSPHFFVEYNGIDPLEDDISCTTVEKEQGLIASKYDEATLAIFERESNKLFG